MIKMIITGKRKPSLSLAEFDEYWNHKHGALGAEVAEALHFRKYVQNIRVDTPAVRAFSAGRAGTDNPPDFVVEVWFDSAEDMAEAFASPEGRKANERLLADEENFIDRESIVRILVQERTKI